MDNGGGPAMSEPMTQTAAADLALLIERARRGDTEAFGAIYDRHAAVVLSVCRARLRDCSIDEADDACQETFIRAFRKIDQVDEPAGLRAWLYAIARHVCSERDRARRRRTIHETSHMKLNGLLIQRDPNRKDAARASEQDEQMAMLTCAIRELPDREALALHLYYLDPDPVAAAHEAIGVSRSGFYKLLSRAKDLLRARLAEHVP